MTVVFERVGFKDAAKNFRGLGRYWKDDFGPALEDIMDDMAVVEEVVFNSGGRRAGGMWRNPTIRWQRRKIAKGLDLRTMHATKRLRRSLTQHSHADAIREINVRYGTIRFGTKVPYARAHQKGQSGMPKRQILQFTKWDHARWARMLSKASVKAYRGKAKKRK